MTAIAQWGLRSSSAELCLGRFRGYQQAGVGTPVTRQHRRGRELRPGNTGCPRRLCRPARGRAKEGFALLPFLVFVSLLVHALSQQVSKGPQALRGLLVLGIGIGCRCCAGMPCLVQRQRYAAFFGVDAEHGRFDLITGVYHLMWVVDAAAGPELAASSTNAPNV